jgi:hypothetical protein
LAPFFPPARDHIREQGPIRLRGFHTRLRIPLKGIVIRVHVRDPTARAPFSLESLCWSILWLLMGDRAVLRPWFLNTSHLDHIETTLPDLASFKLDSIEPKPRPKD